MVGKAQRLRPNIRSRSPRSASSSCKSAHQWISLTNAQFESALHKARKQPGAAHVEILLGSKMVTPLRRSNFLSTILSWALPIFIFYWPPLGRSACLRIRRIFPRRPLWPVCLCPKNYFSCGKPCRHSRRGFLTWRPVRLFRAQDNVHLGDDHLLRVLGLVDPGRGRRGARPPATDQSEADSTA